MCWVVGLASSQSAWRTQLQWLKTRLGAVHTGNFDVLIRDGCSKTEIQTSKSLNIEICNESRRQNIMAGLAESTQQAGSVFNKCWAQYRIPVQAQAAQTPTPCLAAADHGIECCYKFK
jgi:hypothetical protein